MHIAVPHILVRAHGPHIIAQDHRSGRRAVALSMQEAVARLAAKP